MWLIFSLAITHATPIGQRRNRNAERKKKNAEGDPFMSDWETD
jgi:hypothetical protein